MCSLMGRAKGFSSMTPSVADFVDPDTDPVVEADSERRAMAERSAIAGKSEKGLTGKYLNHNWLRRLKR